MLKELRQVSALLHPRTILGSASFWAAVGIGLKVGAGVVVLPLALNRVPREVIGLYYACTGLTSLLLVLDFGFCTTITRFASYAYAGAVRLTSTNIPEKNEDGSPNLALFAQVSSGARLFYLLMSGMAFLALLAFGTPQILELIRIERLPHGLVYFWVLLLVASAMQLMSTVWVGVISGGGKVLEAQRITAIGQLLGAVSMVFCLLLGGGIWAFPIGILVSAVYSWISSQSLLAGLLAGHKLTWSLKPCLELVRAAWPMAWRSGVSGIGTYFSSRYLVVIISNKVGLDASASYGLALQVFSVVAAVLFAPVTVVFPRINMLRIAGDTRSIRRLFFSRLYLGVCLFILAIIGVAWGVPGVLSIIGSKTPLPALLASILIGFSVLADQHQNFYRMLVVSTNVNPFVLPILGTGGLICFCSFWLAPSHGLLGVLIAQIVLQLLLSHTVIVFKSLRTISISSLKATFTYG